VNGAIPCVIVHTILGICEFSIKIDPLKWSEDDRRYGICVLKYGTSAGSTIVQDHPGLSYLFLSHAVPKITSDKL